LGRFFGLGLRSAGAFGVGAACGWGFYFAGVDGGLVADGFGVGFFGEEGDLNAADVASGLNYFKALFNGVVLLFDVS